MSTTENIKVAVRVRPFSNREIARKAQLIVSMEGSTTTLIDPNNVHSEPRKFTYDHSYWSHDGFKERENGYREPENPRYIDQDKLFSDLGKGMLANAWHGYNCSIFAYGQTGSGKSYSIMGHGPNTGLVPRTAEELFARISEKKRSSSDTSFEVTFSMLELYNEQVRDLLNKKKTPPGGLTVKESPSKGFYVESMTVVPVGTYSDIKHRLNEGDRQRTIAATKMNETSSRAHTIVTIHFKQNNLKNKTTKIASISLVDLAGSERASQTEATGDRFEESKNINKSLMTLGSVLKGLCHKARGQNTHIPYRDSVLTKLLKNALGGNSKTVMIAAISPDAENYEQTLSTLRYADRAKSIKTVAKVNKEETSKLLQELINEKERLLKELEGAKKMKNQISDEELQRLKEEQEKEILRYKEQLVDTEKAWEKRLEDARKEMEEMLEKEREAEEEQKKIPHLYNLNEDPALVGKLRHLIKGGAIRVGNGKEDSKPDIMINGPRIAKDHAILISEDKRIILRPINGHVLYNGKEIVEDVELQHQDRIRFGSNNLFVFNNPHEAEALRKKGKVLRDITYEFAQNEIAKHSGLDFSAEDGILQEEVMSIMQLVQDVNAMAEDMDKAAEFQIMLVSAEARGLESGRTEVYVKMHDLETGNEYPWDKKKFLNRQVHMQEMYQQFEETGSCPKVEKEKDPFWEPPSTHVIIGVVSVPLNYISHMLAFTNEPLTVIDYRAKQVGFLEVDLLPCDSHGEENEDMCVEDPMDLVGHTQMFKIQIHRAMNLPERFVKSWCRYRFYTEANMVETGKGDGKNPRFEYERTVKIRSSEVTHKYVDYLREKSLVIEVWGQQGESAPATATAGIGRQRQEEKHQLQSELSASRQEVTDLNKLLDDIQTVVTRNAGTPAMIKIQEILKKRP